MSKKARERVYIIYNVYMTKQTWNYWDFIINISTQ